MGGGEGGTRGGWQTFISKNADGETVGVSRPRSQTSVPSEEGTRVIGENEFPQNFMEKI